MPSPSAGCAPSHAWPPSGRAACTWRHRPAEGEDRRRGSARRDHPAGARRLELARQQRRRALRRARQRRRGRRPRAVRHQAGLRHRRQRASDPYADFETRIVPENITLLPKTAAQVTGGNPERRAVHLIKKGDTVASILRELGATPRRPRRSLRRLAPGTRRRAEGRPEAAHADVRARPAPACNRSRDRDG